MWGEIQGEFGFIYCIDEDTSDNNRYVHLLVLQAERAWAQAMRMQTQAASGKDTLDRSAKRQIVSKFRQASTYAQHIVCLLQNESIEDLAETDVLEAQAYFSTLRGSAFLQKRRWADALDCFCEAWCLYTAIVQINPRSEAPCSYLLTTNINSSVRYAAYQVKIPRSRSVQSIVQERTSSSSSQPVARALRAMPSLFESSKNKRLGDVPKTITWRARVVSLEDASLAEAVGAAAAAEQSLLATQDDTLDAGAKAAAYDGLLLASQDAVDAARDAIEQLVHEGVPQSDARIQSLQVARTAVTYALIERQIGRNRVLCGAQDGAILEPLTARGKQDKVVESSSHRLRRLRERVALFDATLQSIDMAQSLPGAAADLALVHELNTKRAYFAALRCLVIARSHSLLGRMRDALALLNRAQTHVVKAAGTDVKEALIKFVITSEQVQELAQTIRTMLIRHQALTQLHSLQEKKCINSRGAQPLSARLNLYQDVDLENLVNFPPKIQPVYVKPIFLDLAYNYIDYPGRRAPEVAAVSSPSGETKRSWFGFGR